MTDPLRSSSGAEPAAPADHADWRILPPAGLDDLIQILRRLGRTVIGPTIDGGVITHQEIGSAADLPQGWTEDQDGGRYRLEPTGTDELFAFSSPSTSWKRFLYPERTLLLSAVRDGDSVTVLEPEVDPPPMAFFGIRSCDLAALSVLDRVFADPDAPDPWYRAARDDVFIVAVACGRPGNTCFCVSMGTGPAPEAGFDIAVTERCDDERHEYLVRAGSERGRSLLDEVRASPARPDDVAQANIIHERAAAAMGRRLDAADPPLAAEDPLSPRWEAVADRCLACANCTMVCPTCFCSSTEDVTDLSGDETSRYRIWDSCFTLEFSTIHGGPVRDTISSRYRQWLLHKLVTWHDQFDTSGCVGCGRCITWCPVGIDLTAEVAALAADRRAAATPTPTTGSGP